MPNEQKRSPYNDGDRRYRLKLWEIVEFLICPVVGQCLTVDEQRQVLKRTKYQVKKLSRHELHEILVSCAHEKNHLSSRVDALLNRKFGGKSDPLLRLDADAFMIRFRADFKAGEYHAALWAGAVHPCLPLESRQEIFGEIHMAMHFNGDERTKLIRKLGALEKKIDDMQTRKREAVGQRRVLQKENTILKRTVAGQEAKIAAAEREKEQLTSDLSKVRKETLDSRIQQNLTLKKHVESLHRELAEIRRRETALKEENTSLAMELAQQREAAHLFRREARDVITKMTKLSACSPACPAFDLCKKRVLIVGGISRMESLYRELIENSNGIFEYHDGHIKNGIKKLESRLKRADVVLCPVNCNSHGACSVVKNLAKKHRKTVHMLSNYSLNTVSGVLHGGNTVRASLN